MVALSFYGIFREWERQFENTCYKFSAIFSFALLPSSCFNFHISFKLFCQTTIIEMPSLIRKKGTCENCGTQTTRNNSVCHKKRCSVGTLYCTQCPSLSTKSQNDLNYYKKHSPPKLDVTFKFKLCYQEFPRFYALRQHRNNQHGMQIRSGTRNVDVEHIARDIEDHRLREELRSCQHFLVDSELERARLKVFNYALENLNAEIVDKKLDHFFNNLKCAAKLNLGFRFILKIIEGEGFRYFYAQETNTLLDDPNLCAPGTTWRS